MMMMMMAWLLLLLLLLQLCTSGLGHDDPRPSTGSALVFGIAEQQLVGMMMMMVLVMLKPVEPLGLPGGAEVVRYYILVAVLPAVRALV